MTEPAHETLAKVWLFAGLTEGQRRALAVHCRQRVYPKHKILFHEGDPGGVLHVIQKGRIKIYLPDEEGHEVTLCLAGPGDVLGEVTVIDGGPRSATAEALEDTVTLTLQRQDLLRVLHESPAFALSLAQVLAERLRKTGRLLREVLFLDVEARLGNALVELASAEGRCEDGVLRLDAALSHVELASMIGASREATTRALRRLRERGLIRIEGRVMALSPLLEELSATSRL